MEGKLNTTDIELKQPGAYTLISAGNQNTTLVSLGCRRMAREFPATNFVHIYPGTVATEILTGISKNPVLVFVIRNFLMPVLKLFAYTAEECGERVLFDAFGGKYPAHGAYLVGGNCEEVNGQVGLLEGYEGDGVGEKVWRHTLDMWEGAVARGR